MYLGLDCSTLAIHGTILDNEEQIVSIHKWGSKKKTFDERFPEIQLTDTDKDALTHFYGQTLSQQQEGTVPTILAGLFNELRGLKRGYTSESVMADLINNMSAVLPDLGEQQQENYGNILTGLIQNPNSTVPNELLQKIVDYGLNYTVDPPERQKY